MSFLPTTVVRLGAATMFLVGAVILFREGRSHQRAAGEEVSPTPDVHGLRAVLASFLVLFAAEWGDLSQLLTISLVAKYEEPGLGLPRRAWPRCSRSAGWRWSPGGRCSGSSSCTCCTTSARRSASCWPP